MKRDTAARLRVLLLEDNPADVDLLRFELERRSIDVDMICVETRADFEAHLDPCPDVILSDYRLPQWDALQALNLVRERHLDVPFIVISGVIGEDLAVEAMRRGADDYLVKDRLSRLGSAITQAIERKHLRGEARAAAAALQERDAGLRRAQLLAGLAHVITGQDGSFESWSETLPRLIGVDSGGLPKSTREWLEIIHPEDREKFRANSIGSAVSKYRSEIAYRLRHADGHWIHVCQVIEPVDVDVPAGNVTRWFSTIQDITAATKAAEDLRASELRYSEMYSANPQPMWVFDPESLRFLSVNDAAVNRYGWSREEFLAMTLADIRPDGEIRRMQMQIALERRGQELVSAGVYKHRTKDGTVLDVEISAHFIAFEGRNARVVLAHDITARMRAEHELERFRMAMDVSVDSIYLTDPETMRFVYLNDTACRRLGYTREQLLQMGPQDVLPHDRDKIKREFDEVIAAGERGVRHERRYVRNDGGEGWTELHRRALVTAEGTLIVTIGRDISERREADERIRRLNRIYAVLSGINSLIVRARDRDVLYRGACDIAAEAGQFRSVWIGIANSATQTIDIAASAGGDKSFAMLGRRIAGDSRHGPPGLAAVVMAAKKYVVCNDIEADREILAYRKESLDLGYRSVIALPLTVDSEPIGVFVLYAGEVNFFDEQEIALLDELAGDISFALEHIRNSEQLDYLAYYDDVTGLANRTLFRDRLGQFITLAGQENKKLAVMKFNVERFKTINDTFGRQAGDGLLKQIAERARCQVVDSNWLGCMGGDQFAVILPDLALLDDIAPRIAATYKGIFDDPFDVNGTELRIAAKTGIAMFPDDGTDAEPLLRNAESALKKAKTSGERYLFYTEQMTERVAERLNLENKLRRALENEEFVLHYQPKVDLGTGAITGVEALIRWNDPETGLVPPAHFIPLLEETGLIMEVGRWAMTRAVLDHLHWVDIGLQAPRIAVNVSPIQMRQRDFVEMVKQAIAVGTSPPGVDLEITESLIMEDIESNIGKLKAIRDMGLTIYIDDFGTGYSSLGYLARLPVQSLKIDRSFVITMLEDPNTMALVSTIISLAHSLRLKVVAEGVDQEEQARILRLLRCEEMQGYLFSEPLPRDQLTELLKRGV